MRLNLFGCIRSGGPSASEPAADNPAAGDSDSEDDAIGPRIPQPGERLSLLQQQEVSALLIY